MRLLILFLPGAFLPCCLSRAASMCFLGSSSRAYPMLFPLTSSDRRTVVAPFQPSRNSNLAGTQFKFGRRRLSLGLSSPRIERRYRSSVTALNVRGFLLASVRRCNCTPTRSRGSRRSPTPRAFLVRVEAELPGRVSSTTRERRLQVAPSRPRRVRGAGLRELNVIDAAAVASYY